MDTQLFTMFGGFALLCAWCLFRIAHLADKREAFRNLSAPAGRRSPRNGGAAAAHPAGETHTHDLKKGQFLLPPTLAQCKRSCGEAGAAGIHRRGRVYVTVDAHGAAVYTATAPTRPVAPCEVEPEG